MQDFYRSFNRDCELVSQLPILDILILGLESIYPLPDNRALIILWVWLTFSNCKLV